MKETKEAVQYTPKAGVHDERCGLCRYFLPKSEACTEVIGKIVAAGWCKLFSRK